MRKNSKNFSKLFIVLKRLLGHTDHLYTYKRYVEHVGFTEKMQKTTKIAFFGQNKAQIKKPTQVYFIKLKSHSESFLLNKIFKLKFQFSHYITKKD